MNLSSRRIRSSTATRHHPHLSNDIHAHTYISRRCQLIPLLLAITQTFHYVDSFPVVSTNHNCHYDIANPSILHHNPRLKRSKPPIELRYSRRTPIIHLSSSPSSSSTTTAPVTNPPQSQAVIENRSAILQQRWRTSSPLSRRHRSSTPSSSSATTNTINPSKNKLKAPLPIVGYDAETICHTYDRRPFTVGWRLNILGLPLLGWYISLLIDRARGVDGLESVQRKRGEELREHFARSGSVALIKSGQALSLRPDVLRNKIWAEELGKLVDEVGSFSDDIAMEIIKKELSDLKPQLSAISKKKKSGKTKKGSSWRIDALENDPILSLFEFANDGRAVASASIGQVYKAKLRRGPALTAALGPRAATHWAGRTVAVKVQRPDAAAAASLDMYLIRRAAYWAEAAGLRGKGDVVSIVDQFGAQLFGELDYIREADNCMRFREVYGDWEDLVVPEACLGLTRGRVLVMEWVDGVKGPWDEGIEMVRIGLRCSVDQLLNTGLFHADPHRGNLLKTRDGKLAFIDFGMMADVAEYERYGLIGLVIGLKNKDLPLISEKLQELGFMKDATQLDTLVPRLRDALFRATGGSGKASDVNFARLQAELDAVSRSQIAEFRSPPFFTVIIRSLTILEGLALDVDSSFRLIRGAYPYVLKQLLDPEDGEEVALRSLLVRLLTVDGQGEQIEWERLFDFLRLAQKASKTYDPSADEENETATSSTDNNVQISPRTVELFFKFLTSKTGLFLKKPLAHELAMGIEGMASAGELSLLRMSGGLLRSPIPGGPGPLDPLQSSNWRTTSAILRTALTGGESGTNSSSLSSSNSATVTQSEQQRRRVQAFLREFVAMALDRGRREEELRPIVEEVMSVARLVAVEILERRGRRAVRSVLGVADRA